MNLHVLDLLQRIFRDAGIPPEVTNLIESAQRANNRLGGNDVPVHTILALVAPFMPAAREDIDTPKPNPITAPEVADPESKCPFKQGDRVVFKFRGLDNEKGVFIGISPKNPKIAMVKIDGDTEVYSVNMATMKKE
mgnify:CR=1 FL=1